MSGDLPPVPRVDPTLLAEHRNEHLRLDALLVGAQPAVSRLVTRLSLRTMVAAVANVRPSVRGGGDPPLFPPPRAFLSAFDRERLKGVAVAYRHVDSLLAVVQMGRQSPPALRPETPYVLNALTEGRMDNPDETNPGMIRAIEFEGNLPAAPYPPPPSHRCRDLLESAVAVATSRGQSATVRAAWMLFVFGEIHPFIDGNGRVARLLYLLLTGEDMPRTVDWGAIEQFRYHQDDWIPLLKDRDVGPSAAFTIQLSTAGARLTAERLHVVAGLLPEVGRLLELAPPGPELIAAVWLRASGRLDELAEDTGTTYEEALIAAQGLVTAGLLERIPTEPRTAPSRPSYRVTPSIRSAVDGIVARISTGSDGA